MLRGEQAVLAGRHLPAADAGLAGARGADLTFLSGFPDERESLFPPLSYLEPTGWKGTVHLGDATFTVVKVEPVEGRAV